MYKNHVLQDLQYYHDVLKYQQFGWMQAKSRMGIFYLAVCNVISLCAATNLVIKLNPEDKISVTRGIAIKSLGFVYFMSLFELLNALALFTGFGARFRHKYRLSYGDVLDITNKLVSTVHAILACVFGTVVCLRACTTDFMRYKHYIYEAYLWFSAAYFLYDIWSMFMIYIQTSTKLDPKRRSSKNTNNGSIPLFCELLLSYCRHNPVILTHHLYIPSIYLYCVTHLRGDFGDCSFGFVHLMEVSTPFVSLRVMLSRMKLKASKLYLVNGILMLITFFVCRVINLPYVCLLYSRVVGINYLEAVRSLPMICKMTICIIMVPQLYWFYLMSFGAVKMLVRGSSPLSPREPLELRQDGKTKNPPNAF